MGLYEFGLICVKFFYIIDCFLVMRTVLFGINVLFLFILTSPAMAQSALGVWRDHLNHTIARDVDELSGKLYVGTANSVFVYSQQDNSVEKLTKINGLSDIGIVLVRAYPERSLLLIGYQNGNIDILKDGSIQNFPDIRNSTVVGDKSVNHAYFYGDFAYLSTGLGVLRLDIERLEIKDTYEILAEGGLGINETNVWNDTLYAATNQGLYFGSLSDDLSIFSNWILDATLPNPFGNVPHCASNGSRLYVNTPGANPPGLYTRTSGGSWTNIFSSTELKSLRNTPGGILLATATYIERKGPDGLTTAAAHSSYGATNPNIARAHADADGNLWIADRIQGLVKMKDAGAFEFIAPDGPASNNCFSINYTKDELWIASGSPSRPGLWNNSFLWEGFFRLKNGAWTNFTRSTLPIVDQKVFADICYVYPDPEIEGRTFVSSWFSGLIEMQDDELLNYYSVDNSTLADRVEFPRNDGEPYVAVTGMNNDGMGNIWMANGYTDFPLSVRKADGTWRGFQLTNVSNATPIVQVLINRDGYKWLVRNGNGIAVFNDNGTIDITSDDVTKLLIAQPNAGGLPSNDVYMITEDLDGQIWVGTADGIAVFFSPFDVFSNSPSDARQILVEQDGIFQFLFEGQPVSAIAVDGANRKWVGTFGSGVFLMSPDGTEEILRFTTDNSPLLSNEVRDIKIDPKNGTVYIATNQGLMSYQGDAKAGLAQNNCSKVYPNPVYESYQGPITIEGLQRGAEVRISDVRGNLVYSTISNGGIAVWDGRNLNNQRVNTGVYFASASSPDGSSTCVTKILVVK